MAFSLKLLRLLHLDGAVLALREVVNDQLVRFFPLIRTHIHFKRFNILASLDEEGLSLLVLANLGVVASDLDLVRAHLISWLVFNEVNSAVPVAGLQR